MGWKVIVVWECDVEKKLNKTIEKTKKKLENANA